MTDKYRLKGSMYRKCSFIALKLAISLHLLKDSTIFIQNIFFTAWTVSVHLYAKRELVSYWGTVATKCTTVAWIAYKWTLLKNGGLEVRLGRGNEKRAEQMTTKGNPLSCFTFIRMKDLILHSFCRSIYRFVPQRFDVSLHGHKRWFMKVYVVEWRVLWLVAMSSVIVICNEAERRFCKNTPKSKAVWFDVQISYR